MGVSIDLLGSTWSRLARDDVGLQSDAFIYSMLPGLVYIATANRLIAPMKQNVGSNLVMAIPMGYAD